jgi:hypothetical protein
MDVRRRHLTVVSGSEEPAAGICRMQGCSEDGRPPLGFCGLCEAVYCARQQRLHEDRTCYAETLEQRHSDLFDGFSPGLRDVLLQRSAAHLEEDPAGRGFLMRAFKDFCAELQERHEQRRVAQ